MTVLDSGLAVWIPDSSYCISDYGILFSEFQSLVGFRDFSGGVVSLIIKNRIESFLKKPHHFRPTFNMYLFLKCRIFSYNVIYFKC